MGLNFLDASDNNALVSSSNILYLRNSQLHPSLFGPSTLSLFAFVIMSASCIYAIIWLIICLPFCFMCHS